MPKILPDLCLYQRPSTLFAARQRHWKNTNNIINIDEKIRHALALPSTPYLSNAVKRQSTPRYIARSSLLFFFIRDQHQMQVSKIGYRTSRLLKASLALLLCIFRWLDCSVTHRITRNVTFEVTGGVLEVSDFAVKESLILLKHPYLRNAAYL